MKTNKAEIGNARAGYGLLFTICGFAYIVAFALHHLFAPRLEQVPLSEAEQLAAGPESDN